MFGSASLFEVDEVLTREELNIEEGTLQLSPKLPFKSYYDKLYVTVKKKQSQEQKT